MAKTAKKVTKEVKKATAKKSVVNVSAPKKVALKKVKSTYVAPAALPVGERLTSKKTVAATKPNTTEFKIVSGVEKPVRQRLGASPYPFASLPVGDSFLVAAEVIDATFYAGAQEATKAQAEALAVVSNRMSGAVRRFTKRNEGGAKFTVFGVFNGKELGFDHDIGTVVKRIS